MMKHYEKPDILRVDNLNEGVYLASGDPVCGSKYLMGNWIKPSRGTSQGERLQVWGCEGCPADDGNGCMYYYENAQKNSAEIMMQNYFQEVSERCGKIGFRQANFSKIRAKQIAGSF